MDRGFGANQQEVLGGQHHQTIGKGGSAGWHQPAESLAAQGREADVPLGIMAGHEAHGCVAKAAASIVEKARQPLISTHNPTAMKAVPAIHLMATSGM